MARLRTIGSLGEVEIRAIEQALSEMLEGEGRELEITAISPFKGDTCHVDYNYKVPKGKKYGWAKATFEDSGVSVQRVHLGSRPFISVPTFSHDEILAIHGCCCVYLAAMRKRLEDNPLWPENITGPIEDKIAECEKINCRIVCDYMDPMGLS